MAYTVGQAAKATGKSKPTISRAIKTGVLSATKNENGSYTIDPAELHRVFPAIQSSSNDNPEILRSETPALQVTLQREIELLRERLADKDAVIDDLQDRLDREADERRRLTAILTDQRAKAPEVIAMPPPASPGPAGDQPVPPAHVSPVAPARNAQGSVPDAQGAVPKAEAGWWRRMMGGR
jgi:Helix-turn-helix domain